LSNHRFKNTYHFDAKANGRGIIFASELKSCKGTKIFVSLVFISGKKNNHRDTEKMNLNLSGLAA